MSYTEDTFVEQPAINLFADLGWQTINCYSEKLGEHGLLGRETSAEVVLLRELRKSLTSLSPTATTNEIQQAIDALQADFSAMSPTQEHQL